MNFELAIEKAMVKFKLSKKEAVGELTVFMCGHGTIEDFRDFVNYLIMHQEEWL